MFSKAAAASTSRSAELWLGAVALKPFCRSLRCTMSLEVIFEAV
jgi:hypothetical protein